MITLGCLLSFIIIASSAARSVMGQGEFPDTGVFVTTQDFSSLRTGPGPAFARITVVDPVVTIPAIGRSVDGRWVQVVYDGQSGWIAAWLLVWTGDFASLQVDGVDPEPFVRVMRSPGGTVRETPLYINNIRPGEPIVRTIPRNTNVEITARLGNEVQILYEGQTYWTYGSYIAGSRANAFDASYVFSYTRVSNRLAADIVASERTLEAIGSIWVRLATGSPVSCGSIPDPVTINRALRADLGTQPVFTPLVNALDDATTRINSAISLFEDACLRPDDAFFVTESEVRSALETVDGAQRALTLVLSLQRSLAVRDPLINPDAR
ncbi:MAG: SH3 domain-containing protein [Chloroflexi bacterium]|nr:SH3 domain-containing protein [Chloroflexota bacterium]